MAAKDGWTILKHWAEVDIRWRLAVGALVGWFSGKLFGWVAFNISLRSLSRTKDGFVALEITFAVYGVAQLVGGYAFIAVFLSAVAFRDAER